MIGENIIALRKIHRVTQEELAEKIGVSRQTLSKWETGESTPDLDKARVLADELGVSLDALASYDPSEFGVPIPPKGKHAFGIVTVGDKGQIVIPAKARKVFNINPGDNLFVLGDEAQGLAIVKAKDFMDLLSQLNRNNRLDKE